MIAEAHALSVLTFLCPCFAYLTPMGPTDTVGSYLWGHWRQTSFRPQPGLPFWGSPPCGLQHNVGKKGSEQVKKWLSSTLLGFGSEN